MGQARSSWAALIVSAMVLVAAPHAHANPKAAAVHNRQGKAYFDAKQYDEAIGEFKKSYDLERKPITLFKIASAHYAKADYAGAIDYYGQYLQADPEGPYAAQALEFTTIANRALAEAKATREAADAAARQQTEAKVAAADAEAKQRAAATRVKNAEAFVKAGAWASAGEEYRAASAIDGDPAHLLDAAEAYRKKPDHAKASDAYRAYLERVSTGAKADEARAKLAASTRALEEAEAATRAAAAAAARPIGGDGATDRPSPPQREIERGWSAWGLRVGGGFSMGTKNPIQQSSQGRPMNKSFDVGVFAHHDLSSRFALRPELSLIYRSFGFDGMMMDNAVDIRRAGVAIALPLVITLQRGSPNLLLPSRLGVGVFIAGMPFSEASLNAPGAVVGDQNVIDPGVVVTLATDIGAVALEASYRRVLALGGFGKVADDFDTASQTLLLSLSFSFGL